VYAFIKSVFNPWVVVLEGVLITIGSIVFELITFYWTFYDSKCFLV